MEGWGEVKGRREKRMGGFAEPVIQSGRPRRARVEAAWVPVGNGNVSGCSAMGRGTWSVFASGLWPVDMTEGPHQGGPAQAGTGPRN